jgi:gamma-glutamyltranspeptidase/glutathione hydrolase
VPVLSKMRPVKCWDFANRRRFPVRFPQFTVIVPDFQRNNTQEGDYPFFDTKLIMFTTRPELIGSFGMVSSTHWLASSVGMAMLEKGGNAFDAAVAAGLVLQVVEPHLNGAGGDLSIILHRAGTENMKVICGQGTAPSGATVQHYHDLGLDMIPGTGLLATVIPGAFDAWMLLLRDYGTMTLREVFEPALHYCLHGIPVLPKIRENLASAYELFMLEWQSSAKIFFPKGKVPDINTLLCNPTLADTWIRVITEAESVPGSRETSIDKARATFYQGFVAEAIDRYCREEKVLDNSGRKHSGILSVDDLANWNASYEDPVTINYAGLEIGKCGPWSQGPVQLQALALLKEMQVDQWNSIGTDFVHFVTEVLKLAFADREAYYGDPDYVKVPMEQLLSKEYNELRSNQISADASLELRPGHIQGFRVKMPEFDASGRTDERVLTLRPREPAGSSTDETQGDTCHVDIVDRWGNMVAAIPSGGSLASSPVIPELGFCLNSRAEMFWLQKGLPSTLEPGKRPRTTLGSAEKF